MQSFHFATSLFRDLVHDRSNVSHQLYFCSKAIAIPIIFNQIIAPQSQPEMLPKADEFQARAEAATARALSASNPAEALGKSLTEADTPKIFDGAKSFAALVAARSLCTTDADAAAAAAVASSAPSSTAEANRCTFHKASDPTRTSLLCARSLLMVINSTEIPEAASGDGGGGVSEEQQLENDVIRVVWNGCVNKSKEDKASGIKPSKALGRRSLLLAYSHVLERIKRGDVSLPAGVDTDEAMAFFYEFGQLLKPKDGSDKTEEDDDHFLIWSLDGGAAELNRRRRRRTKRGKEAAAAAEAEAKAKIASALGSATDPSASSVTIEELPDDTTDR